MAGKEMKEVGPIPFGGEYEKAEDSVVAMAFSRRKWRVVPPRGHVACERRASVIHFRITLKYMNLQYTT